MTKLYQLIAAKSICFGLLVFLKLLLPNFSNAQTKPVKAWDKTIGGNNLDRLTTATQTTDGGFFIGGWSYSGPYGDKSQPNVGLRDYWVVKLDTAGNKVWDKNFGGSGADSLLVVIQTLDGGYLIGGASNSNQSVDKTQPSKGSYDFWVIKLDATGNKIWDKTLGGSGYESLEDLQQTTDGGYILGGTSKSGISGDRSQASKGQDDYWIIKLDAFGNKLWDKAIGGNTIDQLEALQQTKDGGFILGGRSFSGSGGDKSQPNVGWSDFWVVKLDAAGNKIWDGTYGGPQSETLHSIQQTKDGGYIMGGDQFAPIPSTNNLEANYWVVKIDSMGIKQWEKNFTGFNAISGIDLDMLNSVHQTTDGGFILGGGSDSDISADKSQNSLGFRDFWLIKIDSYGNKIWDKTIGGTSVDVAEIVQQTSDGGVFIAGWSMSPISNDKSQNSRGSNDYWVVKLNAVPEIQTTLASGSYCAGSTVNVPFTITGTFNPGNIFTAQLLDADGNLPNPVVIGSVTGVSSGVISATLPVNIPSGSNYYIRVIASDLPTIGSASLNKITIESVSSPIAKPASRCGSGSVILEASGANASGHYQWYTSATGANAIAGATSAVFATPSLSASTTYYVTTISSSGCESARVPVVASIENNPAAPSLTGAVRCGNGTVTLRASGAPAGGSYKWYAAPTGGNAILSNNTGVYATPSLNATTSYFVATVNASGCESLTRTPVEAKIDPAPFKPNITLKDGLLISDVSANISWYRNDTLLSAIIGPEFKPTHDGKYVVKTVLGNCEAVSDEFVFKRPALACTLDFNVFPNPSSGNVRIQYFSCKKAVSVLVYNAIGQKLKEIKILEPDEKNGADLDLSYLPKGLYVLQLRAETEVIYSKIVLN